MSDDLARCATCNGPAILTESGDNVVCGACGWFEDRCTCDSAHGKSSGGSK